MSNPTYDLVVIGGGSAGLTAATIAGKMGAKILLVDKERLGGDCLYYGCVPSKALIKCARLAHDMRQAAKFGLQGADPKPDIRAVLQRVWSVVSAIEKQDSPEALAQFGIETLFGGARFLDPKRILVGEREVQSRRFLIAVGSHAQAPAIEGLAAAGFIDHRSLFHLDVLPQRLVVIGGGPIGIEMGQALARLGSHVTILEAAPEILAQADQELAHHLKTILDQELDIETNAQVVKVEVGEAGKRVHFERDGSSAFLDADEILVAVGRKPNLEGLDLERCAVAISNRGIRVDSHMRTTAPNIWAAGDCTGGPQFTHLAEAQARVAARNALFKGNKKYSDQGLPWTIFSDPELAQVGLTEQQASQRGLAFHVYKYPYAKLDRALTEGRSEGMAKVVADKKGRILGAGLLGPGAGESLSEFVSAMREGIRLGRMASTIHVYPTMNRIVRRLADQPFMQRQHQGAMIRLFANFRAKRKDA